MGVNDYLCILQNTMATVQRMDWLIHLRRVVRLLQ